MLTIGWRTLKCCNQSFYRHCHTIVSESTTFTFMVPIHHKLILKNVLAYNTKKFSKHINLCTGSTPILHPQCYLITLMAIHLYFPMHSFLSFSFTSSVSKNTSIPTRCHEPPRKLFCLTEEVHICECEGNATKDTVLGCLYKRGNVFYKTR